MALFGAPLAHEDHAVRACYARRSGCGRPCDSTRTSYAARRARRCRSIERLHEEFRRRVKTQGSLPSEDAALTLLFGLVVSGQIKLRRIDGWRKIAAVLSQHTTVAA